MRFGLVFESATLSDGGLMGFERKGVQTIVVVVDGATSDIG
jgi:hypothetical protein